jgi:uncharacterized tellurite resistance protein B-like protein
MIIIGSTQLTFTKESGTFHCPNCKSSRPYRLRYKREFLTIYFIPLIPLQKLEEFLECEECRNTFEPRMASMTAEEIQAAQRQAATEMIRRALVVIVAADDYVSEEELEAVGTFARENGLPDVTAQQILREATAVRGSDMNELQYLAHVAGQLSEQEKDQLVQQAFLAATAGGELSEARQLLLKKMPNALGVEESRFRQLIAEAANGS